MPPGFSNEGFGISSPAARGATGAPPAGWIGAGGGSPPHAVKDDKRRSELERSVRIRMTRPF